MVFDLCVRKEFSCHPTKDEGTDLGGYDYGDLVHETCASSELAGLPFSLARRLQRALVECISPNVPISQRPLMCDIVDLLQLCLLSCPSSPESNRPVSPSNQT